MEYKPLEPNSLSSLGIASPSFSGASPTFLATSTFIYMLLIALAVGGAFVQFVRIGGRMMMLEPSESNNSATKKMTKNATLGLLGILCMFLFLFTINKDLVTGNVGLAGLRVKGGGSVGSISSPNTSSYSGTNSKSCESVDSTIAKLKSPGGLCAGTTCKILTGCRYTPYLPIIERETNGDTLLKNMIIVTMCKESGGNPNASNKNEDGTYDCGLMQVNQSGVCEKSPSSTSQEANIKNGIALMKEKRGRASQTYLGIPAAAGVFASYNCCSNRTVPNSPSADCTAASGFPSIIPKWACPINPGDSSSNMCAVRSYTCELSVCLEKL